MESHNISELFPVEKFDAVITKGYKQIIIPGFSGGYEFSAELTSKEGHSFVLEDIIIMGKHSNLDKIVKGAKCVLFLQLKGKEHQFYDIKFD